MCSLCVPHAAGVLVYMWPRCMGIGGERRQCEGHLLPRLLHWPCHRHGGRRQPRNHPQLHWICWCTQRKLLSSHIRKTSIFTLFLESIHAACIIIHFMLIFSLLIYAKFAWNDRCASHACCFFFFLGGGGGMGFFFFFFLEHDE